MNRRLQRRAFLGGTVSGFFAFACRHGAASRTLAHETLAPDARGPGEAAVAAERLVVLWMNGGPSQFETIDPKPGTGTGGETQAIATSVPGIQLSETLPRVAARMDQLCLLRGITSPEGEHERAQYYLHTGYAPVPAFPRPSLGALMSHQTPPTPFPRYVSIGSPGYGPAYLGPDHAPFSIADPREALELLQRLRRRRGDLDLLQQLGSRFDRQHAGPIIDRRRAMVGRLQEMVTTPFVQALDLTGETETAHAAYGASDFGRRCLLARRLLEAGVRCVEVQQDGWDTHQDNFRATRRLCEAVDQPWAALLDDLRDRGLLETTLFVWMGEFGRTPRINPAQGRDHFPQVTPAVLAGAGIPGGSVIGSTNAGGTQINGDAHTVPDLFATLLDRFGVAPDQEFTTAFGSPTQATDSGRVIPELAG